MNGVERGFFVMQIGYEDGRFFLVGQGVVGGVFARADDDGE